MANKPVYKKMFSSYSRYECPFMFTGGTHEDQIIKNATPVGISAIVETASEQLHKEIDAFEKEEGDITIVKRSSSVAFTTMRDNDDWVACGSN